MPEPIREGLIYKIEPDKKTASVLYDSSEDEITDLLFDKGCLYAAATSYKSIKAQLKDGSESKPFAPGRPENKEDEEESSEESKSSPVGGASLKIANTGSESKPAMAVAQPPENLARGRESSTSHIYKIDPNGFVTDIFNQTAVFLPCVSRKANFSSAPATRRRFSASILKLKLTLSFMKTRPPLR